MNLYNVSLFISITISIYFSIMKLTIIVNKLSEKYAKENKDIPFIIEFCIFSGYLILVILYCAFIYTQFN